MTSKVASLTILLDKIEAILAAHTSTIIERVEGIKPPIKERPGEYNAYNHGWITAITAAIKEIKKGGEIENGR